MLCSLFCLQGRFEIAESFAAEATLSCEEELRKPFSAMHSILKEVLALRSTRE